MSNRLLGTLYGQAIGDALGLPAEFKSSGVIAAKWPDPKWPSKYENTVRTLQKWDAGEWSDDTEQALCILDAYLQGVEEGRDPADPLDLSILASQIMNWAVTNGRGMGKHTEKVLENPLFCIDPVYASQVVWEASQGNAAPNGAVMRTSYVSLLRPWDLDWTAAAAADAARTTHYDPRCVASAVAVSVAIAANINGEDSDRVLTTALRYAKVHDPGCEPYITSMTLEELQLDEGMSQGAGYKANIGAPIGFTYKCLGAAFWAFRECLRREDEVPGFAHHPGVDQVIFLDVLRAVIRAGGDTDTNGAVAGAMLGSFLGAKGTPDNLILGLNPKSALDTRYANLLSLHATAAP
jgi:ADP-ribosylglycohydrolase